MPLSKRRKCLKSALQNSLRADINPASRRHLPIHHQALAVEFVKVLPVGPLAHQVGVGDDHPRRHLMRGKHSHRLAALHQQRLFAAQPFQLAHDGVKALPVARRLADAAIDHQVRWPFGHFRIEVVHQAAQRRLLLPALAAQLVAARRANRRCHRGRHALTCLFWPITRKENCSCT